MELTSKFNEEKLLALIQNKVEEGQYIDYKSSSTFKNPKWKESICVDVSAFANSSGGIIVYGITEGVEKQTEDNKPRIFPQAIDGGIDPGTISKESIIQVLQDGIQRPVKHFFDIVKLSKFTGKVAYVLRIPQSFEGPHQVVKNKDFRYYQRYETQNVPMQDWQIRDVANRQTGPDLLLHFEFTELNKNPWHQTSRYSEKCFEFQMPLINLSKIPATHMLLNLYIDNRLNFIYHNAPQISEKRRILPNGCSAFTFSYQLTPNIPIFDASPPFHWDSMNFIESKMWLKFKEDYKTNTMKYYDIEWEIFALDMTPRKGLERITYSVTQDHLSHESIKLDGSIVS